MQRVIKRCVDANVNLEAYDRNRNLLYNGLKECRIFLHQAGGRVLPVREIPGGECEGILRGMQTVQCTGSTGKFIRLPGLCAHRILRIVWADREIASGIQKDCGTL